MSLAYLAKVLVDNFADDGIAEGDSAQKELFAAWALFISIVLLIMALFTSYMLQMKKVTAVHETVISIFAGKPLDSAKSSQRAADPPFRNDGWPCFVDNLGRFDSKPY